MVRTHLLPTTFLQSKQSDMDFTEKTNLIASIFFSPEHEIVGDNTPLQDGNYYGGTYNGRKYMYAQILIENLPIDKLEAFIKRQIGYETI